jgi:hypothetical protein
MFTYPAYPCNLHLVATLPVPLNPNGIQTYSRCRAAQLRGRIIKRKLEQPGMWQENPDLKGDPKAYTYKCWAGKKETTYKEKQERSGMDFSSRVQHFDGVQGGSEGTRMLLDMIASDFVGPGNDSSNMPPLDPDADPKTKEGDSKPARRRKGEGGGDKPARASAKEKGKARKKEKTVDEKAQEWHQSLQQRKGELSEFSFYEPNVVCLEPCVFGARWASTFGLKVHNRTLRGLRLPVKKILKLAKHGIQEILKLVSAIKPVRRSEGMQAALGSYVEKLTDTRASPRREL